MYFTPEFEAAAHDVEAYVAVMLAETNEGYMNSNIPIRVELFCIEKLNIAEIYDGSAMLGKFKTAKGMNPAWGMSKLTETEVSVIFFVP